MKVKDTLSRFFSKLFCKLRSNRLILPLVLSVIAILLLTFHLMGVRREEEKLVAAMDAIQGELRSLEYTKESLEERLAELANEKDEIVTSYQIELAKHQENIEAGLKDFEGLTKEKEILEKTLKENEALIATLTETLKGYENKDKSKNAKEVYLTFDDGPSNLTMPLLDVLDEYQVKGSFFINGVDPSAKNALSRIVEDGHSLANHTYSHDYNFIYGLPENFYSDIVRLEKQINELIGYNMPKIFRFPGGSINSVSTKKNRDAIKELMDLQGYVYYDWNSDGQDSIGAKKTSEEIYSEVIRSGKDRSNIVILLHNTSAQGETIKALPDIIKYYRDKGYVFRTLDERDVFLCQF